MLDAISVDEVLTVPPFMPVVLEEFSTPDTSDAFNVKLFRIFSISSRNALKNGALALTSGMTAAGVDDTIWNTLPANCDTS